MRILLVDDEEEFVSALAERLRLRGIAADWSTNAESALKKVEDACYELAILDVKMPKTGGGKLRESLMAKCPDMKVIFLTGHGSEEEFMACTSAVGTDCYLIKPIHIDELIARIKAVFQK